MNTSELAILLLIILWMSCGAICTLIACAAFRPRGLTHAERLYAPLGVVAGPLTGMLVWIDLRRAHRKAL